MNQDKELILSDDPLTKMVIKVRNFLYRQHGFHASAEIERQEIERIIRQEYKLMDEKRHGSPEFYHLLEVMADLHDRKSHDYANDKDPFGNYHFAGKMSKLFNNPSDAGFLGRLAEKIYRLANLENSDKTAKNEGVDDTELDICVITTLWMASRAQRRIDSAILNQVNMREGSWEHSVASREAYLKKKSEEQSGKIIELLHDIEPEDRVAMRDYINALIRDDNVHKGS